MGDGAPQPVAGCALCAAPGAELLHETPELHVVRVDDPMWPGYLRVIWRAHRAEMTDLTAAERDRLMHTVFELERRQRELLGPDKINLASLGNQAPHLHWHLIPRWRDDPCFPGSIWSPPTADAARQRAWAQRCAALAPQVARLHAALRRMGGGGPDLT